MKRYILLLIILTTTLTSCSIDDGGQSGFYLEVLPIDSVVVPQEFVFGQSHEILITYNRPSLCYEFNDFIYEISGNERTVAIVNTVYTNNTCISEPTPITVRLNFTATSTEPYLFKFYQGEDDMGQDQYLLIEVPVIDE